MTDLDFKAEGRLLRVVELPVSSHSFLNGLRQGFIAIMSSKSLVASGLWPSLLPDIVRAGVGEVCFFGPGASAFHDKLDQYVESQGMTQIVTTDSETVDEAAEYVIFGAGAGEGDVLFLTCDTADVRAVVIEMWAGTSSLDDPTPSSN